MLPASSTRRPAVDALLADVWDSIESSQWALARWTTGTAARRVSGKGFPGNQFTYRKEPGPSKRRRCREWGVVYVTRPGEEPDPVDGTNPSPGPTPSN
jgi:hypothetical protein